jgi:hypothetical protein
MARLGYLFDGTRCSWQLGGIPVKSIPLRHMSCVPNAGGVSGRPREYWPQSLAPTMYSMVLPDNEDPGRQLGQMDRGR